MVKICPFLIKLNVLGRCVDPLDGVLWGCERITREEIREAVAKDELEERNWDTEKQDLQGPAGREFHIKRIAYFVAHGIPSDNQNIQVFVGDAAANARVSINNGNHRIAAAIMRGEDAVRALIYFLDMSDVEKFLPKSTPTE